MAQRPATVPLPRSPDGPAPAAPDPRAEVVRVELPASLEGLRHLAIGRLGLEQILTAVARYALPAVPGADGVGVTLLQAGRRDTTAATAPFVQDLDEIALCVGEGPGRSAVREGRSLRSGSLGGDQRWPRFGPRAGRMGVHSVLSIPLTTPEGVLGALTVYGRAKNSFAERAEELGQRFAGPASVLVQNAHVLDQARRLAPSCVRAMDTRTQIDQALGIIRSRSGCSSDDAFAKLRALSQTRNVKLSAVAATLVDEAVRRARARHSQI